MKLPEIEPDTSHMKTSPAGIIEYALLRPEAVRSMVAEICAEAVEYAFHAVVVNPCYVAECTRLLRHTKVVVGSVVGYPLGATCNRVKTLEAERIIAEGAREVDMVINIGALKSRELGIVEDDVAAVRAACPKGITLKVILECCLLTDEEKGIACEICERAGADFVKTSTGMSTGGATVHDVHLLRSACPREMGIKAAGGIKSLDDVAKLCGAGACRIGTSSAVEIVEEWKARNSREHA